MARLIMLAAFLAFAGAGGPQPAGAQGTPVEIHAFLSITGFNAFIGSAYAQTLKIVENDDQSNPQGDRCCTA